jgi:membrane protease YdiL (CAAX protease family)
MKLKNHPFKDRISFILSDSKRLFVILIISILIVIVFPFINPFSSGLIYQLSTNQTIGLISLSLLSFCVSFIIQIFNSWKPDYKQDLKAAIIFSGYLFWINAFIEEFFFRLILLTLFNAFIHSPIISVFLTSAIFGYYHIPLFGWSKQQAFIAFIAGLCFGTIYFLTNSFIIVWFVHGFADLGFIHESIGGYIVWTKIRKKELGN